MAIFGHFESLSELRVLFLTNYPPLNKRFLLCFKSLFKSIPVQKKTVSEVPKTWYFFFVCILIGRPMRGGGLRYCASLLSLKMN